MYKKLPFRLPYFRLIEAPSGPLTTEPPRMFTSSHELIIQRLKV